MQRFVGAVLVSGLVLTALEVAVSSNVHPIVLACDVLAGWSFVIAAALTDGSASGTRVPILFLATAAAWFVGPAIGPWQLLYLGPLCLLLVAYPTGVVRSRAQRTVVAAAFLVTILSGFLAVTPIVPLLLAVVAITAWLNAAKSRGALRRAGRSASLTALTLGIVMAAAGEAASLGWISADLARVAMSLAVSASALWLAADLRWGGSVDDALERLVIELGDAGPNSLRDMLRAGLNDDTLALGYGIDGGQAFVDERGLAVVLPNASSGRVVTPLVSHGEQIGVLIRDAGSEPDQGLADGVAAAASLAMGNARLTATVGRQLADLSASRGRLVAAVEAQRARLQADVANRIAPRLLDVDRAIPPVAERDAAHLHGEIAAIVRQLRELATGFGPTDVAIHGLPWAIRSMAEQCPVPVTVVIDAPGVVGDCAATAFFVTAEGLANTAKHARAAHAWVDVQLDGSDLVIEVRDDGAGGAVVVPGSGLDGLGERLRARGGSLDVRAAVEGGVRLRARLPAPTRSQLAEISDLVSTA